MNGWNDGRDRYGLVINDTEVCMLYYEAPIYFVRTYMSGQCKEAAIAAISVDAAKQKAIEWLIGKHQEQIDVYREGIVACQRRVRLLSEIMD